MSRNKTLLISLGILSCIFYGCNGTNGVSNVSNSDLNAFLGNDRYADLKGKNSPEEIIQTLGDFCIRQFKDSAERERELATRDWSKRGRQMSNMMAEHKDSRLIDDMSLFTRLLKIQVLRAKESLRVPDDPRQFLMEKAEELTKIEDLEEQKEYWGNLEFYLGCYAAVLLNVIENCSCLTESEKVNKYQEVIDGFYSSYEKAFENISGIKLEFKEMCEKENDYNFILFKHPIAGNLTLVKGIPIMVMESLALVKLHPISGKEATLANLGRGMLVSTAKELNSTTSFEDNQFLISFALRFCSYVREVIDRVNKKLVCFQVTYQKVPKVQENSEFLFRSFREVIDKKMDEVIFIGKMVKKEGKKFSLLQNNHVENRKGTLYFITDGKFLNENDFFKECLNIDQVKLGKELVGAGNSALKDSGILKNNPNAYIYPLDLAKYWTEVKPLPL